MRIILCALIGLAAGVIIGEYYPSTFASGLDTLGAAISEPFSPYRNGLARRYGLFGGLIGAVIGFMWMKSGPKGDG